MNAGEEVIEWAADTYCALPFSADEGPRDTFLRGLQLAGLDLMSDPSFWRAADDPERVKAGAKLLGERNKVDAIKSTMLAQEIAKAELAAEKAGPPSWARIDPVEALDAASSPREPEVGRWAGNARLGVFYSGAINEVHGESESGKTWIVLHVVAQTLAAGGAVAYVDFEDDAASIYRRLTLLGVPTDLLRTSLFRYHRPAGPLTDAERAAFRKSTHGAVLVVFDGLTESLALEGLDGNTGEGVAAWHAKMTRPLSGEGVCVVIVDHQPHGVKRATGSQHKRSALTGVSYQVEAVGQVAPGQRGCLSLRVAKDRHGAVRKEAAPGRHPRWRGNMIVDFSAGTAVPPVVTLVPAGPASTEDDQAFNTTPPRKALDGVVRFVTDNPGCSSRSIRAGVKGCGGHEVKDWAVEWLVAREVVKAEKDGQRVKHTVLRGLPEDLEELDSADRAETVP